MSQETQEPNLMDRLDDEEPSSPPKAYGRAPVPAPDKPAERPDDAGPAEPHDDEEMSLTLPSYVRPAQSAAKEPPPAVSEGVRRPRPRMAKVVAFAVVIVALFGLGGFGYSQMQPTVYGAQADFILTHRSELSDAAVERAMVTQTMIVTSDPVLTPVAEQASMSVGPLRDSITAEIVGRSNVLRVTVASANQARSVRLVQLITDRYLETAAAPTGTSTTTVPAPDRASPVTATVLSTAAPLRSPLQPRPVRAVAAGILLGLLVAAAAVAFLLRPRWITRPSTHWE
ncbi:MAG TPA: hypothetical protein VK453_20625 [Micromonosporaceae bacterium]|nr:hypothetical protein [Micromonosporaceae bacterium]